MRSDKIGFHRPAPGNGDRSWNKRIVSRLASVEFPGASVRSVLASTLVAALLAMNIPGYAGGARASRITGRREAEAVYGPWLEPDEDLASGRSARPSAHVEPLVAEKNAVASKVGPVRVAGMHPKAPAAPGVPLVARTVLPAAAPVLTGAEVEAATVRHAPQINGNVIGSVRQLTGESTTINGPGQISAALLAPGTPQLTLNGTPTFGGTIAGPGSAQPSNYQVILNGNATLGRLVTQVDPISLATVTAPLSQLRRLLRGRGALQSLKPARALAISQHCWT